MLSAEKKLIQDTWAQVLPAADRAATLFYQRLFEIDPNRVTPNPADNTITELTPGPLSISLLGFGQDARGELYVLGNATGTPFGATGVVLRIRTPCPNNSGDNIVCND